MTNVIRMKIENITTERDANIMTNFNDALASGRINMAVKAIINAVAAQYHIVPIYIISQTRTKNIAAARHMAMYITRRFTQISYPEIGVYFNKDHSTVIGACQKMEIKIKTHPHKRHYNIILNALAIDVLQEKTPDKNTDRTGKPTGEKIEK